MSIGLTGCDVVPDDVYLRAAICKHEAWPPDGGTNIYQASKIDGTRIHCVYRYNLTNQKFSFIAAWNPTDEWHVQSGSFVEVTAYNPTDFIPGY